MDKNLDRRYFMKAKEMFKKLNYRLVSKNENKIIYEFNEVSFIGFKLTFTTLSKDEIRFSHSLMFNILSNAPKGAAVDIDLKLNEAIQQQLKELGGAYNES